MKISRIHLEEFHQFKNLDIDLTYPKGHAKEGKPLDKVCIIGQSGTGKTTLLKIISGHTFTLQSLFSEFSYKDFKKVSVERELNELKVKLHLTYKEEENKGYYTWTNHSFNGERISFEDGLVKQKQYLAEIKPHLISFPADLKYDNVENSGINFSESSVIDFAKQNISDIWNIVFAEVQKYQEEELKLKQEIAKVAVETADIEKIQKSVRKLERWQNKTINPITQLADDCLDPLLKIINLKVKREFKFESKEDIGFIKIEDFNGNEVPYTLLSTGTKQILLSALPLYLLKPNGTLILYDEPERSLYPNLQKFIVDYYISLTANSQFYFATHSPLIASCFDPWEIIELKFDESGYVYQELYYPEGKDRHVDNYTIIPSYLTYDLILSKVFDLEETYSNERSEKVTEVLMLRNQLKKLKEEDKIDSPEAKSIYNEYKSLASKLFWDFELS